MSERPAKRCAILVLGMHRAGTSAVTRVLNLLGAELGSELLPPKDDNPTGFWEHAGAVAIHERLLRGLNRSWFDTRGLPEDWAKSPAATAARQEIAELIRRDFDAVPLWALKDPRLSLFAPLWLEELDRCGIGARVVIVVRHPEEVVASLLKRERRPRGSTLLLWLQYLISAELASRNHKRVLLPYDELLLDWRDCAERIGAALQLEWQRAPQAAAAEIDAYLDGGQRHHRFESESTLPPLVQAAWDAALDAARRPAGWDTLMQIEQRYAEVVPSFVADIDAWVEHAFHLEGRALHAERLLNSYIADPDVLREHTTVLQSLRAELDARLAGMPAGTGDSAGQFAQARATQATESAMLRDQLDKLAREVAMVRESCVQAFAELSAQVRAAQSADSEAVRQAVATLAADRIAQGKAMAEAVAQVSAAQAQMRDQQAVETAALSAQIEALVQQLAALQQFVAQRGLLPWLRRLGRKSS